MKKKSILSFIYFALICLLVFSACSSNTGAVEKSQEEEQAAEEVKEESMEINAPGGLTEEKIAMEITTSDGRILDADFYPAAKLNAPVVVLLHWAGGEKADWIQIAYWLQNRGLAGVTEGENGNAPWLDSSWFPEMPADRSYNVLTFTFDGCGSGGCQSFEREKWLLDAQAAFEAARTLEGVDPTRIVGVGASIGSDGAADGCLYLDSEYPGTCKGALSLSPGNYLTLNYADVVEELSAMDPAVPTQCFYAVGDTESATVCQAIQNTESFTAVEYQGSNHGMRLIMPDLDHDTLTLIMEFISDTVGTN